MEKRIPTMFIGFLLILVVSTSGCINYLDQLPEAEPCEDNSDCKEGYACDSDSKCHVCGNADFRVCCDGKVCEKGLTCLNNQCRECGNQWDYCCEGKCDEGCECSGGQCHCCGWIGEKCCPGEVCNEGAYCDEGTCKGCIGVNNSKELSPACGSRG